MGKVADLLCEKSRQGRGAVYTISPEKSVLEAARVMNERRIGALVVVDGGGRVKGIFTERDVMSRVVSEERSPEKTLVGDVMTAAVIVASPTTTCDELRALMRERRVRHMPVIEDGALVGMVSIGDINAAESRAMVETISYLERYIYTP